MAIENDVWHSDRASRLRSGLAAEITLSVAAALIFLLAGLALLLAGQHAFGIGLVAIAPWLPFLVIQDYWRWLGFMHNLPGKALANDTLFNIVQASCFLAMYLARSHSIVLAVGSWGAGATVGAIFGLWQFSVRPAINSGFTLLRSRWHMSKWLAGQSVTAWGSSQASILVAAFILTPVGLGGLRAAQTLVTGPTFVLIMAGGSVGLPEASKALAERGWRGLRRVAWGVSAAAMASIGLVSGFVFFMGSTLLRVIYGPAFAQYWPSADLFAVSLLLAGLGIGPILILKVSRRTRRLFAVQAIGSVVSVCAVVSFALLFGVTGVAAAGVITAAVTVVLLLRYGGQARKAMIESDLEPDGTSVLSGPGDLPAVVEFG
jgi:O-antigen/teichoic acid export membrane protein